jgi:crotonobetainyl-CoA:carnitine CoA-transferase CaiB-like acyl-CoA transferase
MLENLRVVELGQVIAGTIGGMVLADLGAEVIKVEHPAGDPGRRSAVYGVGDHSAIHLMFNRNKKSISVNLKEERGRRVLLDLVARSDAVIENFRPGVLDRLGVGFDRMREANPDIVLASVTGFGANSPYSDYPAYNIIVEAMSSHLSIMGEPDRAPVVIGVPIADMMAGVYSAIAVLAGLEGRRTSGEGVHFDIAMLDVMVGFLAHVGTLYLNTGEEQEPKGSAHPFITPWQAFRCADGKYVVVAPREEHFWKRLVDLLDLPELSRPEFGDAVSRYEHRDALLPLLEAEFEKRTSVEWIDGLRAAEVPVAPVNRLSQIFSDPHVATRGMVQSYDLEGGTIQVVGNPIKVDGADESQPAPAPSVGSDTDAILETLLGYDAESVSSLRAAGVVR